jgi:hypothetical protein
MKIAIVGAGLIGHTIAHMLRETGDYEVVAFDRDADALAKLSREGIATQRVDSADANAIREAVKGFDALVNALPYYLAVNVAAAAKAAGVHYFDLTEDVRATHAIRELADGSDHAFMPQCGLAPGFIGIAAHELVNGFSEVRDVKMRVGALPEYPTNALKYNLTWSVDGLINEYCQPCEAIRDGRKQWVQPLEGLEHFSLDGTEYEAFNTSGGLGTLCETLSGKVESLDYKSVRYPGHRAGAVPARGPAPVERPRHAEGDHAPRGAVDEAGRRARVRHGDGREGRPARAGRIHAQDFREGRMRDAHERDPDHDGWRDVRGAGSVPRKEAAAERFHPAGEGLAEGVPREPLRQAVRRRNDGARARTGVTHASLVRG